MVDPYQNASSNVLIVDTDQSICLVVSRFLEKNGYTAQVACSGDEALKLFRSASYDLVLCDYRLPDLTGVELLQKIKILNPAVAVIITTGDASVQSAVEAFRCGASDYVGKPFYPDELLAMIGETIVKNRVKCNTTPDSSMALDATAVQRKSFRSTSNFIVGTSASSQAVQRAVELIASSDMSVIITGETGTGKEFVAQSIHQFSNRSNGPFMAIDCGALPKDLAGSELFGHTKGSFTGAIADKAGSFELADGGTIFLDEIGNLSYENQVRLLRMLQERRIKRIGGTKDLSIDVRIITATNENLFKAVKAGNVREDLYHRLNEFKIQLLPLRERKDDIMFFAGFFLDNANRSLSKNIQAFSAEAERYMLNYYWSGNLRELNNVVKRSVLLTTGDIIEADSLPPEIRQAQLVDAGALKAGEQVGMLKSIAWTAERQTIIDVLERVDYNKSRASLLLNIDRKTLYNKLKLYAIGI